MPQIGSFALLLGLALAAYSFIAGALALYRNDDRLGETARRAGIACWAAVTVAAVALVMAAFGNDFSVAYILPAGHVRTSRPPGRIIALRLRSAAG